MGDQIQTNEKDRALVEFMASRIMRDLLRYQVRRNIGIRPETKTSILNMVSLINGIMEQKGEADIQAILGGEFNKDFSSLREDPTDLKIPLYLEIDIMLATVRTYKDSDDISTKLSHLRDRLQNLEYSSSFKGKGDLDSQAIQTILASEGNYVLQTKSIGDQTFICAIEKEIEKYRDYEKLTKKVEGEVIFREDRPSYTSQEFVEQERIRLENLKKIKRVQMVSMRYFRGMDGKPTKNIPVNREHWIVNFLKDPRELDPTIADSLANLMMLARDEFDREFEGKGWDKGLTGEMLDKMIEQVDIIEKKEQILMEEKQEKDMQEGMEKLQLEQARSEYNKRSKLWTFIQKHILKKEEDHSKQR